MFKEHKNLNLNKTVLKTINKPYTYSTICICFFSLPLFKLFSKTLFAIFLYIYNIFISLSLFLSYTITLSLVQYTLYKVVDKVNLFQVSENFVDGNNTINFNVKKLISLTFFLVYISIFFISPATLTPKSKLHVVSVTHTQKMFFVFGFCGLFLIVSPRFFGQ